MFGLFKFQIVRYFNHFAWFFLSILIVATFIFGSIFACVGVFGSDLQPTFLYLFSSSQLTSLFASNPQAASLLNVCINLNGDIANTLFNFSSSQVSNVDILQNTSNALTILASNLTNNTGSLTIPIINSQYNVFYYDVTKLNPTDQYNSPFSVFTEWNKWSDPTVSNSYVNSCNTFTRKDRWVQNITLCPNGYTTTTSSTSQTCYNIPDSNSNVILSI